MAFTPNYQRDIQFAENVMGNQTFTWEGSDYLCVPSTAQNLLQLGDGGFEEGRTLVLLVRKGLFGGTIPVAQDLVTFRNVEYRIDRLNDEPSNAFIKLYCVDESRGI